MRRRWLATGSVLAAGLVLGACSFQFGQGSDSPDQSSQTPRDRNRLYRQEQARAGGAAVPVRPGRTVGSLTAGSASRRGAFAPANGGISLRPRVKPRTEAALLRMAEQAGAADPDAGLILVRAARRSVEAAGHQASTVYGIDTDNTAFAQADYTILLADRIALTVGAQYHDQRSGGDELINTRRANRHEGTSASCPTSGDPELAARLHLPRPRGEAPSDALGPGGSLWHFRRTGAQ